MNLVTQVYKCTQGFPKEEVFGLTSQIRRCSVSIPNNIAEGYGRVSSNEFVRFLNIATGSLFELQTQIEIAHNLNYIPLHDFQTIHESSRELERMLTSFIDKVRKTL